MGAVGRHFTAADLKRAWWSRYASLSRREKIGGAFIVLFLWTSNACTFFGLNLWLFSFEPAKWSNFISIWLPAMIWAVGYAIPVALWKTLVVGNSESWGFVFTRRSLKMIIAIGILDSMGGLTSVYSAKLTPIFLQTMLSATGPIWTFFLTKIFYPERARPFTVYPAIAFTLITIGVITSGVHQFAHIELGSPWNIAWCFINLLGIIIPPTYATIQGKYMYTFSEMNANILSTRLIVLAGDTMVQAVATTLYFPLDATPWFGTSPYKLGASWEGFKGSLECVRTCEHNGWYMLMYVGGFYCQHVVGVIMNHYSPTLMAVVGLVGGPINVFLLIMIPALQVSGAPGYWYLQLICFVCTLSASILFIVWEESVRFLQAEADAEAEEHDPLTPETEEIGYGASCKAVNSAEDA